MAQNLKGFRDFLPQEAVKRNYLKTKLEQIFQKWGLFPIETPTLEPLEIFEGQIGEDEKLFYKFKDLGQRDVALRYDQTVPTCRVVGQYYNELVFPFKRYQIQQVFRAERPQKGRYREFTQCDADIFGVADYTADAEMIALSLDIYKSLGFKDYKVLVNDREILKDIPYEFLASVDKLKKIGEEGVCEELIKKGLDREGAKKLLEKVKNLKPSEAIKNIFSYLTSYGFDEKLFAFDPTLVRSFSYSTGPIWEVVIEGFDEGSVLGGERYDGLVEKVSGRKIFGTGFAVGFDRTLSAMEQFNLIPQVSYGANVLVTIFDKSLLPESLSLTASLRKAGIGTEIYSYTGEKLENQIKYAIKKGVKFVAFLGPDEIKNGTVTIKNLQTKEQKTVPVSKLNESDLQS